MAKLFIGQDWWLAVSIAVQGGAEAESISWMEMLDLF